jgi:TolB-like protein/DNA-binding winged helix-turn-helix (wHTH) protein/Tfp pilus assembly protein PilF
MEAPGSSNIFLFEDFRLDRGGLFRRDDTGALSPVKIGSRALDLLRVLVEQPGEVVSKDNLVDAVWPGRVVEDSNLGVQIAAVRSVLANSDSGANCIQTVPGRGYRFVAPVTRREADSAAPSGAAPGLRLPRAEAPVAPRPVQPYRNRNIAIAMLVALLISAGGWFLWVIPKASLQTATVLEKAPVAPSPMPRLSIVVLPFANLSGDKEQQYFADGITEDLTTDLSRIDGSFVISRNTAFTYRGKTIDTKQVGRELGVRYVLEGSVQRSGNQVRVDSQLIDAETDAHLWAERFDGDTSDLFALQDEITSRIAVTLNLELVGVEAARPTEHPDAMDYIFRGRAAGNKPPTREMHAERISSFERALELDPRSVEAQSYLAIALMARVVAGLADSAAADIARAEQLAGQALAASPGNWLAHQAKGQVLRAQRRYAEAIPEYERVLASNRNAVSAYYTLGQCKLYTGAIEETIPLVEKAIRLSPRDPQLSVHYWQIGAVHLLQGRIDDAIVWFEKSRGANPGVPYVHASLASAYALKGEREQATAELTEARRLGTDDRYSSIARLRTGISVGVVPEIRRLYEATDFVGLRKAGMPEE